MAKAGLSWPGDVASQCKARGWVLSFRGSVDELLHGAEALALAGEEAYQSKAGEGEGVLLWSYCFGESSGEWVDAGHLSAVCCAGSGLRVMLEGSWAA